MKNFTLHKDEKERVQVFYTGLHPRVAFGTCALYLKHKWDLMSCGFALLAEKQREDFHCLSGLNIIHWTLLLAVFSFRALLDPHSLHMDQTGWFEGLHQWNLHCWWPKRQRLKQLWGPPPWPCYWNWKWEDLWSLCYRRLRWVCHLEQSPFFERYLALLQRSHR